jgi:hypothetical protein
MIKSPDKYWEMNKAELAKGTKWFDRPARHQAA